MLRVPKENKNYYLNLVLISQQYYVQGKGILVMLIKCVFQVLTERR